MATRLWQSGAEAGVPEFSDLGTAATVASTTKARTGTYSFRFSSTTPALVTISGFATTKQIRAFACINHVGLSTIVDTTYGVLFRTIDAGGKLVQVVAYHQNDLLAILVDGTIVASVTRSTSPFASTNVWLEMSVDIKKHASAGWVKFYIDGVEILSFEGNTLDSNILSVGFGGRSSSSIAWANYMYMDDMYIEDSTGESYRACPAIKLLWQNGNGNGASSQWTGSDGNQTNNFEMVDEATSDGDTTYVYASSADLVDSYACSDIAVPERHRIVAVIPTAIARKTDALVDTELKVRITKNGSHTLSAAKDLSATFGVIFNRLTSLPDGSALTEANVNACEVGISSAGVYA